MKYLLILALLLSQIAFAKPYKRKFPKSHKFKTVHRCLDQDGRWIKGCK